MRSFRFLQPEVARQARKSLHEVARVPVSTIDEAYEKWQRGGLPRTCVNVVKGLSPMLEVECQCVGCLENRCIMYFEVAHQRIRYGDPK